LDLKGATDGVDPKAQISSNSAWSESSRIGEGSIVAKSSIGQHCVVGRNVKIINSIIMEHVQLGDWYESLLFLKSAHIVERVKIENCILSRHTKVGEKTQLKDCESIPGADIKGGGQYLQYPHALCSNCHVAFYQGVSLDGTETVNTISADG
jgi:translation initiation factor eIF-2B subunit gamma